MASQKFKLHQSSKAHLASVTSLTHFLNSKSIDVVLNEEKVKSLSEKEKKKEKNRCIMRRLIDITLCLGIGGKSFRGHNEKDSDTHKGLFLDLIYLLKKYDPILNNHFDCGPRNALYFSNHIQNDVISSINTVIKNQLKLVIFNEQISIIADETSDVGHHEQLSIVVRFFDKVKNCPVEQFICMKRLLSTDSQSIFNVISEVIEQYNIQWNLIASICFDGAAAMSGSINGVQAKFKGKNNKTLFIHCYGHCLNLILVDSLGKKNRVTFDFFGTIQLIYNFIESSCTRHAILEKVANAANIKLKTIKSVSNTRWACRSEAVSAIKANYSALLIAIKQISDTTKQPDVRAKALGLIHQMQTFNFIFALQMLNPILNTILKVSMALQSSNLDLLTAVSLVESLKLSLESLRNKEDSFTNVYDLTLAMCADNNITEPSIKKRRVSSKIDSHATQYMISSKKDELRINVYLATLDQMISSINIL